jgi:septum formation protein
MPASSLVLASASPRRRELLSRLKVPFATVPAEIEETARPGEPPRELAERLAREKAESVAAQLGRTPRRVVLGSDTIVVLGEEVLGKPRDPEHALALLRKLSGCTHLVLTGIAVVESDTGRARSRVVESGSRSHGRRGAAATSRPASRSTRQAPMRRREAGDS